jgi:histidinol dehydrogenase
MKNKKDKKKKPESYQSYAYNLYTQIPDKVIKRAEEIFGDVFENGDESLFRYTSELENHHINERTIKVTERELERADKLVPAKDFQVLRLAARRIRAYHRKQTLKGFSFDDGKGTVIKERLVPLDKAGICVPGGRAPLASTVLMTAIPAKIAGVAEIVMISPWPGGRMNPHVLAAAKVAGVDAVYKIGGVQGVAALACGTKSTTRVDKIVGPGSIWVNAGKAIAVSRGLCGIDSLAGPSEVVVVADNSAKPDLVAIDLWSQVEHGEDSVGILITTSKALVKKVEAELKRLIESSDSWPEEALQRVSVLLVKNRGKAAEAVNQIAPEHLEVMVKEPSRFVRKIKNAASIFVGPYSPVPAGDYMAGGNHVLPTGGTARFSSPLGVYDFVKRQSITTLSKGALESISGPIARFAEIEGLPAHALSVKKRFKP